MGRVRHVSSKIFNVLRDFLRFYASPFHALIPKPLYLSEALSELDAHSGLL